MTISKDEHKEAYVWIWLPGETKPVVAGILQRVGTRLLFNYGRSYLARENAISIYEQELPLQPGEIPLPDELSMPGSIRDASPDTWGRRVLINRKFSVKGEVAGSRDLGDLTYLLESGSDKAGALDFQTSASKYVPRGMGQASLGELLRSAEQVEKGDLRWSRLFGQFFRVLKWKNCSASRRGGGHVEIGFIDFQGLREEWEKQFHRFFHAFLRPACPRPADVARYAARCSGARLKYT